MKIDTAKKAAILLEKIEDLESSIFKMERIKESKNFNMSITQLSSDEVVEDVEILFDESKLSTTIFQQNVLDYAISNFSIELDEIKEELESLD